MLVDVEFKRPHPGIALALTIMGGGQVMPVRLAQGMYLSTHWSLDQFGIPIRERWREHIMSGGVAPELDFPEYGVCDTPEQIVTHLRLRERPERFFVSFVKMERDNQPLTGGWRWHKWGPYIGAQKPQCEYLHDEPEIDTVYTYHVYELQGGALQ